MSVTKNMKCSDTKFYDLKRGGLVYIEVYNDFKFIVAIFLCMKRVIGSPCKNRTCNCPLGGGRYIHLTKRPKLRLKL